MEGGSQRSFETGIKSKKKKGKGKNVFRGVVIANVEKAVAFLGLVFNGDRSSTKRTF